MSSVYSYYQAYDNDNKNSNILDMEKLHSRMVPEKKQKFKQSMIFVFFKIIAIYVNPALYIIFVLIYAIVYKK